MSEISFLKHDKYQNPYIQVPLGSPALMFYQHEYCDAKGKIHATQKSVFGGLVDLACERQPYRQYKIRKRIPGKKLVIMLPDKLKHGKVTEQSLLVLAKVLEDGFKQQFISFVDGAVNTGCSESFAVEKFLEKYKIGVEEWDFHAAKMVYRRAKGYEK